MVAVPCQAILGPVFRVFALASDFLEYCCISRLCLDCWISCYLLKFWVWGKWTHPRLCPARFGFSFPTSILGLLCPQVCRWERSGQASWLSPQRWLSFSRPSPWRKVFCNLQPHFQSFSRAPGVSWWRFVKCLRVGGCRFSLCLLSPGILSSHGSSVVSKC